MSYNEELDSSKHVVYEDFVKFLRSFEPDKRNCPFCGVSRWMTFPEISLTVEGKRVATSFVQPVGTVSESPKVLINEGMNLCVLVCDMCGYVHTFSRDIVLRNIKKSKCSSEKEAD
jgi:hypothetical protein